MYFFKSVLFQSVFFQSVFFQSVFFQSGSFSSGQAAELWLSEFISEGRTSPSLSQRVLTQYRVSPILTKGSKMKGEGGGAGFIKEEGGLKSLF